MPDFDERLERPTAIGDIFQAMLQMLLEEDPTKPDPHSHYCPSCGRVWSHDGAELRKADDTTYERAHDCPGCGYSGGECRIKFKNEDDAREQGPSRFAHYPRRRKRMS